MQQMNAVKNMGDAFRAVFTFMENISSQISNTCSLVHEMSNAREKVLEVIGNDSTASEENAATVQEISASTEEQMAVTGEFTNYAKELSENGRRDG